MMIFVVGPSRAGKTSLIRGALEGIAHLRILDLDAEEERCVASIRALGSDPGGWENRWQRNLQYLRVEESRSWQGTALVDVGAGSLQTDAGRQFFISHGKDMIAVIAPWEIVLGRHPGRDRDEFRHTEYSVHRETVYRAAAHRIDSSCALADSIAAFRDIVLLMIDGSLRQGAAKTQGHSAA